MMMGTGLRSRWTLRWCLWSRCRAGPWKASALSEHQLLDLKTTRGALRYGRSPATPFSKHIVYKDTHVAFSKCKCVPRMEEDSVGSKTL